MSIKHVLKRNGELEEFNINKILRWELWACDGYKDQVNWRDIIIKVKEQLYDKMTTQEIQLKLIEECNNRRTWLHSLIAGRLYSAYINKKIYPDQIPTVKELHTKLQQLKLMTYLNYTDEEYSQIEKIIDHSKNFSLSYGQLNQLVNKYSLSDRVTKTQYETPQFVYMRMAMALAEDEKINKLEKVSKFYKYLSENKLNAPTPNYINLGTNHNGFISCCLYTSKDTAESLGVGDHIAYTMTYLSAGIGGFLNIRSINDKVKSGFVKHTGKLPYFKSVGAIVNSTSQGGRGGSATQYFMCFDPEVIDIIYLQNPRTPLIKQNRDLHFAMQYNTFFIEKVYKDENIFTFNTYTAPDLVEAFFSGNVNKFKKVYNEYENNTNFKKNYIKARDVAIAAVKQAHEVATLYFFNVDEANKHTPYKDTIYQSNLCVAPETNILTKEYGYKPIQTLRGQEVHVWNGEQWSKTTVVKTGENQKLIKVTLELGLGKYKKQVIINATPYHKWYININGKETEKRTIDLLPGNKIYRYSILADNNVLFNYDTVRIINVTDENRYDDTYCVNEPLRNKVIFEGVLTGNCLEVFQPTQAYSNIKDLYSTEQHENGEISLCALAGIVPSFIESDEEYEDVAYYALLMIDKCIHKNKYIFPHLEYTATSRLNAGVGIIGLAHTLAKQGYKYNTNEGLKYIHYLSERHMYSLIKASLKLGKELGNAKWMNKTKWPEGWLPIDTYNKEIDDIADFTYKYDWEKLRQEVINNGGIRNSALVAHMPTESSSRVTSLPNGIYPIRDIYLKKTDASNAVDYVARDSETLTDKYQIAWDLTPEDLCKFYGVVQKFTDQGISADFYSNRKDTPELKASRLLEELFYMYKYGLKSRYYTNSLTTKSIKLEDMSDDKGCSGGFCTL